MSQSTAPSASEEQTSRELGQAEDMNVLASNKKRQSRGSSRKAGVKKESQTFRTYSDEERVEMMRTIAARVRDTKCTFKEAIKDAGISEQTYYQWKKLKPSAGSGIPAASSNLISKDQGKPRVGERGGLVLEEGPDILKLQQENLRLRQIFAEKLQAANDELRKRIALL